MAADYINITAISALLKEKHLLEVTNKELNLMLIATGDLIESAIGKVETKLGRSHGIHGEYRIPPNDAPYWIPLYNQAGVQYVEELAVSVFANRIPKIHTPESQTHDSKPEGARSAEHDKANNIETNAEQHTPSCYTCMLLKNGDCGMPQRNICAFYKPCYIPTAEEIETMENAKEGSGVAGYMTQTALGDPDHYKNK